MDIPDKIYTDKDVKLWRFDCLVWIFDKDWESVEVRYNNPIPVYSGETQVGNVALEMEGNHLYGSFALDYFIEERLDVENGEKVWAIPHIIPNEEPVIDENLTDAFFDLPKSIEIIKLELCKDCKVYSAPTLSKSLL